jgi:hypothetical protein
VLNGLSLPTNVGGHLLWHDGVIQLTLFCDTDFLRRSPVPSGAFLGLLPGRNPVSAQIPSSHQNALKSGRLAAEKTKISMERKPSTKSHSQLANSILLTILIVSAEKATHDVATEHQTRPHQGPFCLFGSGITKGSQSRRGPRMAGGAMRPVL